MFNDEEEIQKKVLILMHYLQHFHETDDFRFEHIRISLIINVPPYQRKLQFSRFV